MTTERADTHADANELDLPALHDYLQRARIPISGNLCAELIAGGRSNLTFSVSDDHNRWVLRTPPRTGLTPSAHDVLREYRVTSALAGTAVPVPRPLLACADPAIIGGPFALADFVPGQTIQTAPQLNTLTDDDIDRCTTELVRVLSRLHQLDPAAIGLADFGRPSGYLERQVALWSKQWQRVNSAPSADMDRLHARIAAAIPANSQSAIVHGDYRIDNTILSSDDVGAVAAVVDWEMATLGDPLADVALMCVYRNPAMDLIIGEPAAWTSPRLPTSDALASQYAAMSGLDLPDWPFYLALANYKVAVIAEGINHRYLAGATRGAGFDGAAAAVSEFATAGLHSLVG